MKKKLAFDKNSDIYLGVGSNHDFSGCVIKEGKIIGAIEAERINRIKHGYNGFNTFNSVIKYLFNKDNIVINSISTCDTLNTRNLNEYKNNINFYNHHLCHASAVFYTSPFQEAAILITDGLGSRFQDKNGNYHFEGVSLYYGKDKNIKELQKVYGKISSDLDEKHIHKIDIPNSLGIFYTYITKIVGFDFLEDGKTMGLASYGDNKKYYKELSKHIKYENDFVKINLSEDDHLKYKSIIGKEKNENKNFKLRADIAASGQKILEEILDFYIERLAKLTNTENLCIGGGVALNSSANGKMLQNKKFKNIFIFPACGDDSIAIGSAYLSYYKDSKNKRIIHKNISPFFGKKYNDKEILETLKSYNIKYKKLKNKYKEAAKLLSENKIIGWFQGGSEFGPRALGHRSLLANPKNSKTRDVINLNIKKREFFRPLAPAILYEFQKYYFNSDFYSPYMLFVFETNKEKIKDINAVVHTDGSARAQSVTKENKEFYYLIKEFYKLTNIPMILNTSFNTIKGEPIVETPQDAIKSFINSKLQYLVIGSYLCFKGKWSKT